MNKFVRRAMILGLLSLNAQAEEKVWHCEMTGHAEANMEGENKYKLEKFKMKVTPTEVNFGSGGYFDNHTAQVTFWIKPTYWRSSGEFSIITFEDGKFHFASALYDQALAISARCDDF